MKKFIAAITAFLTLSLTANAMSYSQAREQALFLTDKMAYELNLTEEQYDAAYEVNLDYLMSVNTYDDLYGAYWTMRNTDLSYILLDWQYRSFCAASYFYRPLYWTDGIWHFAIYSRYPHRNYFYFGRPDIYVSYRGGHGWGHNGGRSWYRGRTFNHGGIEQGHGMRDRFDRGDFRRDNGNNGRGGNNGYNNRGNNGYSNRGNNGYSNRGNGSNRGNNNGNFNRNDRNNGGNSNRPSVNGGSQSVTTNRSTGNFNGQRSVGQRTNRESSTRTTARPSTQTTTRQSALTNRPSGRISTTRPSVSTSRSVERSTTPIQSRSTSVSRGASTPSRSFSGGGATSRGGSHSSGGSHSGGGHFGGRR